MATLKVNRTPYNGEVLPTDEEYHFTVTDDTLMIVSYGGNMMTSVSLTPAIRKFLIEALAQEPSDD